MRVDKFLWSGSEDPFLDRPQVDVITRVAFGRYGGRTASGACKNEDAAFIWVQHEPNLEFIVLLDAHATDQSARLVLSYIEAAFDEIMAILAEPVEACFAELHRYLLDMFTSERFLRDCSKITGETSCIICCRRESFLWWMNVGDCMLFLLHPELLEFDQTLLNQRNFFEWVGRVNTFEKKVPCYSAGVRELRSGSNVLLLCTDGVLDMEPAFRERIRQLPSEDLIPGITDLMSRLHESGIRDSATVIAWEVNLAFRPSYPSEEHQGQVSGHQDGKTMSEDKANERGQDK